MIRRFPGLIRWLCGGGAHFVGVASGGCGRRWLAAATVRLRTFAAATGWRLRHRGWWRKSSALCKDGSGGLRGAELSTWCCGWPCVRGGGGVDDTGQYGPWWLGGGVDGHLHAGNGHGDEMGGVPLLSLAALPLLWWWGRVASFVLLPAPARSRGGISDCAESSFQKRCCRDEGSKLPLPVRVQLVRC